MGSGSDRIKMTKNNEFHRDIGEVASDVEFLELERRQEVITD